MPRLPGLLRRAAFVLVAGPMAATAPRCCARRRFPTRTFIEAVFGRWRLADGGGIAVIYSHRQYGQQAGEAEARGAMLG